VSLIVDDGSLDLPTLPTSLALIAAHAGPPLFVVLSDRFFGESPGIGIQVILQLLDCALAGLIVSVVLRYERLPLGSIGLRPPDWSTLVGGAGLWAVVTAH
jgi:hypothetical protein